MTEHAGRLLGHIGQTLRELDRLRGIAPVEYEWWNRQVFSTHSGFGDRGRGGLLKYWYIRSRYHSRTGMRPLLERRGDQRTGG